MIVLAEGQRKANYVSLSGFPSKPGKTFMRQKRLSSWLTVILVGMTAACKSAPAPAPTAPTPPPGQRPAADSAAPRPQAQGQRPAAGPRPFREVIPASASADTGMFTVYRTTD